MQISILFPITSIEEKIASVMLVQTVGQRANAEECVTGWSVQQVTATTAVLDILFREGTERSEAEAFVTSAMADFTTHSGIETTEAALHDFTPEKVAEALAVHAANAHAANAHAQPVDRSKMN